MMPGVVAGFPRGPESKFTLVSALASPRYGFIKGTAGSISPAYSSILPGSPAQQGAAGEVLELTFIESSPGQWSLWLLCAGDLAGNPPFSQMIIDGLVIPASRLFGASYSGGGTVFTLYDPTYQASNPLPVGSHTITFK